MPECEEVIYDALEALRKYVVDRITAAIFQHECEKHGVNCDRYERWDRIASYSLDILNAKMKNVRIFCKVSEVG